jgi:lysozyme
VAEAKRHWAEHLRLSHHGATFIATEEGVRVRPYRDSRGIVTTGVGHVVTPQHYVITAQDLRRWSFSSPAAAVEFFRDHDVVVYERAVRAALGKASLTQAQYDMCVSLCFNIGTGAFATSRVARSIKAGRMRAAGLAFYGWARPTVLWGRRNREALRFLKGRW